MTTIQDTAHTRLRAAVVLALMVAPFGGVGFLPSCAPDTNGGTASPGAVATEATRPIEQAVVLKVTQEAWTFDETPGKLYHTPSYSIYTTLPGGMLVDRAPLFLEHALANYTSAIAGLPKPTRTMETYLLSTKPQWQKLTRQLLGNEAEPFLRIERGGFSHRGRGVFFDIGPRDTFVIAAHEGWHQYVQTTFRDTLPVWLDEGVATVMEGFKWDRTDVTTPNFMPWANLERWQTLQWASQRGQLMPLKTLLRTTPQELITDPANGGGDWAPLTYYAQVWALVQFLREAEGGKYALGLREMLSDAAGGRMGRRVESELGRASADAFRLRRDGAVVFAAYVGQDLPALEAEYTVFVTRVAARGNRPKIAAGKSPLEP